MKYQSIKNKTSQLKTLSALLIVILLSGCAIPTVIKSKPEGATVYIDNIKMGKTPLTYSDTEILFSQKNIRLEMNGYNSFSSIIKKEKLKVGPLVGACFAGIPGLWALGYAEEYTFELDRGHAPRAKNESAPARAVSEDQPQKKQAQPVAQPVETKSEISVAPNSTSSSIESMVVIESKAKLRKKPSANAAVIKNLKKGEVVHVIKQKGGWCLVELAGGETGWCAIGSLAQTN
ncbi:MAG: SH3 domain-containing protein [Desulfuromonadales bacterium]|nr:SH3 domain-containing protein [Desulfuromonadales bacterium]